MLWSDERYVRVYTRDTVDWQSLSFDAQALLVLLLRKVDRAGLLPLGKHGKRGVSIAIGHPREWPRLEPALEELLADGCIRLLEDGRLFVPNYIDAQEAKSSDKARQQKVRELAQALAAAQIVTQRDALSQNVTESHTPSHAVTGSHAESHAVTPSRAVPCLAVPSLAVPVSASQSAPPEASPQPATETLALAIGNLPAPEEAAKKPSRRKQPAVKREPTGDPRHAPLVAALVEAHRGLKCVPYGFAGGRDAKAVTELLALADQNPETAGDAAPAEILRRWEIALGWVGFPACTGLTAFRDNWNAYSRPQAHKATGDRPRLGPPASPPRVSGDRPRI